MRFLVTALATILLASPAAASDWNVDAHITRVEATYVPDFIYFWADSGAGSCPAGITLRWNTRGATAEARAANGQAELAVLMTALVSGKKVHLNGFNPKSTAPNECEIEYIYLISSQ